MILMGFWSLSFRNWIISVPDGGIIKVAFGDHDNTENGGDIESGPLTDHLVEHWFFIKIFISPIFELHLYWHSPDIPDGLRLVSVVVGLDQKPSLVTEFIKGVHSLYFSLNHCSLADTRNDVVNGCTYFHSF